MVRKADAADARGGAGGVGRPMGPLTSGEPLLGPRFFVICIAGLLVNFAITANPYTAYHGGLAGDAFGVYSDRFVINPAAMYTLVGSAVLLFHGRVRIATAWLVLVGGGTVLGGLLNGGIFARPVSYAYDFVSIAMISTMARGDAQVADRRGSAVVPGAGLLAAICGLGVALSLWQPERFGPLPFAFTRVGRGEVALWVASGCHLVMMCYLAARLTNGQPNLKVAKWAIALAAVAMIVVSLSTMTRTVIFQSIFPFVFAACAAVLASRKRRIGKGRILLAFGCSIAMVGTLVLIYGLPLLLGEDGPSLNYALSGREDLWVYYWNLARHSPIVGGGITMLADVSDYLGIAMCEIGFLRTLAEKGLLVALPLIALSLASLFKAARCLLRRGSPEFDRFLGLIVVTEFPNMLFQEHARLLALYNYAYLYAVVYCYYMCSPVGARRWVFLAKTGLDRNPDRLPSPIRSATTALDDGFPNEVG
jgi:hypothetical protein